MTDTPTPPPNRPTALQFNLPALALALGILWGLAQGTLALTSLWFNYGTPWVTFWQHFYIGYAPTSLGALLGTGWGFFDAGIGGLFFGWLYNRLAHAV